MSRIRHLTFSEGETWPIDCTFLDSDGEALDLTGATIKWSVATRPGEIAIVEATTGNGLITITSPATAGLATILVPKANHSSATPRTYLHEAEVTLASGIVTIPFSGRLTVRDSIFVV